MKYLKLLAILFAGLVCSLAITSCKDDDEPSASTKKGTWYVCGEFATSSDFAEINKAIDNHELLSDYGKIGKHYAEVNEFLYSNGLFSDSNACLGRLRFGINSCVNIIHIIDDITAEFIIAYLYVDSGKTNQESETRVWHFNAGRHFGEMAYYYGNSTNMVYAKKGNTLVFSNGDIFVKKSEGLQGNSGTWKSFTPRF